MSKEKELILEAKHVTKKFPLTKGKELIANDDVSLKFYKGQTLGIVEAMNRRREWLWKVYIYAYDGTA